MSTLNASRERALCAGDSQPTWQREVPGRTEPAASEMRFLRPMLFRRPRTSHLHLRGVKNEHQSKRHLPSASPGGRGHARGEPAFFNKRRRSGGRLRARPSEKGAPGSVLRRALGPGQCSPTPGPPASRPNKGDMKHGPSGDRAAAGRVFRRVLQSRPEPRQVQLVSSRNICISAPALPNANIS